MKLLKLLKLLLLVAVTIFIGCKSVSTPAFDTLPPNAPKRGESLKFHTMQSRMIIEELGITGEKREQFRELYLEYSDSLRSLNHKDIDFGLAGKLTTLPDSVIENMLRRMFDISHESIAIKERYYNKFRTILSPAEIAQMYNIERITRDKFISEMRKRSEEMRKNMKNEPCNGHGDGAKQDSIREKGCYMRQQRENIERRMEQMKQNLPRRCEK